MQVLILTVSEQEPDLLAALRVGAAGYLLKDMPPSELVEAVLGAGAGEPRIPASMASRVLSEVDAGGLGLIEDLSPREREVLELMAEGLRNREIARAAVPQRGDGQDPRAPPARQAAPAQPRGGGGLRRPRGRPPPQRLGHHAQRPPGA